MTTTTTDPHYRIVSLNVSNFMGIVALDITPDGTLQVISGRNGAGKSSALDAIVHTLANGRRVQPPKLPLRTGAKKGKVVVMLADAGDKPVFRVTRTWTEKGDTLQVTSADGSAEFKSPRALLDKLVGELSFDPGSFARMSDRDKAATLRKLVPALDLSSLDAQETALRTERTAVGRERDQLKGQLAGMTIAPAPAGTQPTETDARALLEQKADLVRKRAASVAIDRKVAKQQSDVDAVKKRIEDLEGTLATARLQLATIYREAEQLQIESTALPPVADIDQQLTDIDSKLADASMEARHVEQWRREVERHRDSTAAHVAKTKDVEARSAVWSELSTKIDAIAEEKRSRLAAAELPLPGMQLVGDVVSVNGVPFEQLSSAQQLRVGLEMGARLNPALRVVTMKDGSLLDDDGLKFVAEWAASRQMQVFIERVASGSPVGIVIEDGRVLGAAVEETPAAATDGGGAA